MKIKSAIAAMVMGVSMLSLNACGDWPSACEGLSVSQQDRDAAANGYEVEREDSMGNECELSRDGKSWSVED